MEISLVFLIVSLIAISIMFLYYLCEKWRRQRRRGSNNDRENQNDPNSLPLVNIKITVEDDAGNQKTVTSISDMLGNKKGRTTTIKESDFVFKNLKDQANYMIDENEGIKLTSENFGDFDVGVKFKEDYDMKTSVIDVENNCVASEEKGTSSSTPSRTTSGDVGTSEGTLIVCDIVVDEHPNESTSSKNDLISVPIENGVISSKEDSDSGIDGSISDFEKKDKNEEKENLESDEGPIDEKKNLKLDRPDRPKKKLTMPKKKKTTSKDSESDATTSERSENLHVDTTATALTKDLHSPTSPQPRLFRIQVKDQIFTVDSEYMKELSPIFLTMFYGKDFEKNRELMRVIVDETPDDIRMMLDIIKGCRQIGVKNFALLLRLARKYQITSLLEDCESYVRELDLEKMIGDDILSLLVDSYEYQCSRDVVSRLIVRLAKEGNAQFARLKISRYLNAQIYGSVISTSMNFSAIKEMETMNGHQLTMAGSHTKWEFGYCSKCTTMKSESCMCMGCHTSLCKSHVQMNSCEKEYGIKRLEQLKEEIANPNWTY